MGSTQRKEPGLVRAYRYEFGVGIVLLRGVGRSLLPASVQVNYIVNNKERSEADATKQRVVTRGSRGCRIRGHQQRSPCRGAGQDPSRCTEIQKSLSKKEDAPMHK